MSSAISNSSARRRRRTAQPKLQEKNVPLPRETIQSKQENFNDYEDENIPILGVKESIIFLSNKIQTIEHYLIHNKNNKNETQDKEITTSFQDIKKTVDEISLKLERLDLSIEKINLVLKLHDTYINKIKPMVEFETVDEVTDIKPQLLNSK